MGTLETGGRVSAAEARPLHIEAMRIAMGVCDGGCTTEHCETPPGLCRAHHDTSWSSGGHTNVETGRLLCAHHHRRIHDPLYRTTRLPNGKVRFHRRE